MPQPDGSAGIIAGMWFLAPRKVKYECAYPNGFLERARVPVGYGPYDPVLHVCAGRVRDYPNPSAIGMPFTLDLAPETEPDFLQDAREPWPAMYIPWRHILADPDYDDANAAKHTPPVEARPLPATLLERAQEALIPGGRFGLLYGPSPVRYDKKKMRLLAEVGVKVGLNGDLRMFYVWEKM